MLPLIEAILNGISIGSVLLIAALGLAIVFGLMGVINLAHGELMMIGAYTTFVIQNIFKPLGEPFFRLVYYRCHSRCFYRYSISRTNFRKRSHKISLWQTFRNPFSNMGS